MSRESKLLDALEVLKKDECHQIAQMAQTLTLEECFDQLMIIHDSLPPADLNIAKMFHKKGRADGIQRAGNALFNAMTSKTAMQASLEYLRKTAEDFQGEIQTGPTKGGFEFKMVMNKPDAVPPGVSKSAQDDAE